MRKHLEPEINSDKLAAELEEARDNFDIIGLTELPINFDAEGKRVEYNGTFNLAANVNLGLIYKRAHGSPHAAISEFIDELQEVRQ